MKWLRARIARSPRRVLVIGKTVFLAGSVLILGAVFARAALMNLNADRVTAKLAPVQTLAEAWPGYPTWLVPEGPAGFALAAVLVLLGMALTSIASDILKSEEQRRRGW